MSNGTPDERSVAIVGGGIAGITAAVKLFQQGYNVTIFEKEACLGGNLSSNAESNVAAECLDIYPHIFGDWYREFWHLLEIDLKLYGDRTEVFDKRDPIKMAIIPNNTSGLKTFSDVQYKEIFTPTSLTNLFEDFICGVLSPRDMFLFGYTYLDLVSNPPTTTRQKVLSELDVTGYLYSSPYMNDQIAEFHDDILKVIWSMPTDETSAQAYQNLIRHTLTFPNVTPFAWLAKGPLGDLLTKPITERLEKNLGAGSIRTNTTVTSVTLKTDGEPYVELEFEGGPKAFRYAVIATPALDAAKLALSPSGPGGMADAKPTLAQLREAEVGRIPVVYLRFRQDFLDAHAGDIPEELIGFKKLSEDPDAQAGRRHPKYDTESDTKQRGGGDYDISILNLDKLWKPEYLNDRTGPYLVVAASHATAIQTRGPDDCKPNADDGTAEGWRIIKKLSEYLPFIDPGRKWDGGGSIDWDNTRVITNDKHRLFLNDSASNAWRPEAGMLEKHNVFFAGDYCCTEVDMATVEAATQSGVLAARALQKKAKLGSEIYLQPHDLYCAPALLLAKLMLMPAATAASLSATYDDAREDPLNALVFPYSVATITTAYWADFLRTAIAYGRSFLPTKRLSPSGAPVQENVAEQDNRIGLMQSAVTFALAVATEGPSLAPKVQGYVMEHLYGAWYSTIGRTLFPRIPSKLTLPPEVKAPQPKPPKVTLAASRGPRPPTSWSELSQRAVGGNKPTAASLSNAAFGLAAGAVSLWESLKANQTKAPSSISFSDDLKQAVVDGAAARRERTDGFRRYYVERDLTK